MSIGNLQRINIMVAAVDSSPLQIALFTGESEQAKKLAEVLRKKITFVQPEEATVGLVLGGDGVMLKAMHDQIKLSAAHQKNNSLAAHLLVNDLLKLPLYGINCGTIGFLMNAVDEASLDTIEDLIAQAEKTRLVPLKAIVRTLDGQEQLLHGFNEITLLRETHQASHIEISINNQVVMKNLVGDGVLLSTPAGSTAYNYSAGGPILPLGSKALALTALNSYKPRRWGGAILDHKAIVKFKVLDADHRHTSITADWFTISKVQEVEIMEDTVHACHLLFDQRHNLEARILQQQFPLHH